MKVNEKTKTFGSISVGPFIVRVSHNVKTGCCFQAMDKHGDTRFPFHGSDMWQHSGMGVLERGVSMMNAHKNHVQYS